MADIKNGNPEKSKKKKTAAIVISLAAVCVVAAVIIILLLRSCGGEDTGYDGSSSAPVSSATEQPATGSGQEEPSEPAEPEAPSDGGADTPTVQPENEPPAEAPERPADPVIPDKNSEASDEKTLRELLEYDGDITVTVTDDITVASPITVNGKKALKGDVTISYASDGYYGEGPFIIEMSPESELTVDGITLDGGYRASGIHIDEGANLSFADGAGRNMTFCVFYPDGGTAVVKDGVFEEVSCFDAVVESGSQMFVEGGTWEGTEYNHISVRSTGYLEVSGDALFENSHGTWAKGMLQGVAGSTIAVHGGKFDIGADCKTWQRIIDSAGTIDVSYEGDDPDGMIEMTTSTNIAICAQNGCQSLTVKGVHFYNTACGLYLNDNCRDVTVENCVFDMIEKDSTAIQVAGSRCEITLKNLTINNAYQGMKLTGDDTKLEAWDITLNKVPYVGIWVRSQTEFGQLQENELPCEIILHNYKNLNGGGWGLLAERGVSVTVEDSTFDGCKITAVEARNKTEVKLVRCDFRNNTGKNGGAVICNGDATVEGEDCYFENNDPLSGGGIISVGNIDDVDPAKHTGGTVTLIGKDEARAVIKGSDAVGSDGKRTNAGVVRIAKGSVTIEGYKITDNTGNYGAVAFIKAGTAADDTNILKLKNCTLENNQSALGAIHDEGNNVKIILDTVTFKGNAADDGNVGGGAIYSRVGADIQCDNCTFENNHSLTKGGAIYLGGSLHGKNNNFIGNYTSGSEKNGGTGGAVYINGGTLNLTSDNKAEYKFKGNHSDTDHAAAVYIENGKASISGYTFEENKVPDNKYGGLFFVKKKDGHDQNALTISDCDINGASANFGGVIYAEDNTTVTLAGSTFTGCVAKNGSGGVVYAHAAVVEADNCKFIGNSATGSGGAICMNDAGGDFKCDNCTFDNNHTSGNGKGGAVYTAVDFHGNNNNFTSNYTAAGPGGAVYLNGGTLNLTSDNKAEYKFKGNRSVADHAAAVYIENGKASITGYTFEENKVPDNKYGGLFFVKKKDGDNKNTLTLTDCDVNGASATLGGVVYAEDNTVITLADSTFTGCEAKNGANFGGGVIYANAAEVNTDGCTFNGNGAANRGGAIHMSSSAGKLSDIGSEFTGNTAAKEGGAVYSNAPAVFENTVFGDSEETGNKAGGNGGALYLAGAVTLKGTLNFTGNTTAQNGGAIYVAGGAVTGDKADCKFVKNKAHGESSAGGAIAVHGGGSVTLARSSEDASENCRFENNDAAAANGIKKHNASAIFIDVTGGTVNISGYTFTGHTGNNGGAITVKKKDGDVKNALTLSGCRVENTESVNGAVFAEGNTVVTLESGTVFDSNHATNGGAIYAQETEIKISGCTFNNNSAASGGGAIYMGYYPAGKLTDSGSRFTGNHSEKNGGALLLGGQAKTADGGAGLVNTEFTGNYTTAGNTSGGAVSILNGAELIGSNCLFNDNHNDGSGSEGGAICVGEKSTKNGAAKLTLTATDDEKGKFYNNSSKANGGAIYMCADNKPEVSITGYLFEGNRSDSSSGAIDVRGKLTLKGTSFISNTAGGDAGAMYIHDVEVLIEGSGPDDKALFYKNSANGGGGALVVVGANSNVTIKNADFGAGDNANKAKHQSTVWKTGGTVTATDNVDNYSEA